MKLSSFIILSIFIFCIASCSNTTTSEKEKFRARIVENENVVYKNDSINPNTARELMDEYVNFSNKYPQDSLAAEYLFKAADVAMGLNEPGKSILYLTTIEEKYIDFDKYSTVIFRKAYVYENYLKNINMAREYYEKFITNYPNHKLVEDANNALIFLDVSDEDMIKMFEQMN